MSAARRLLGPRHPWVAPYTLCDFCRTRLADARPATRRAHLPGCAEHTAYRLDPATWLREYWRVLGTAALWLERVAGRPDPAAPTRIVGDLGAHWGTLHRGVFNDPRLAREYGAWRLEQLAAEYGQLAAHFRTNDRCHNRAAALESRILPLPQLPTTPTTP